MANVDAAFGLRPVRYQSGAPYNGAVNIYYCNDSTNGIYIGDPVFAAGTADSNGIEEVNRAGTVDDTTPSNNTPIVGVVVGFASDKAGTQLREDNLYIPAGSTGYALVADDPGLLFEIQEDSVGGALAAAAVGGGYNLELAAGSTVTGLSGVEIDSSVTAATNAAGANVRIVGLSRKPDNEIGTNAVWEVYINNHRARGGVAGV